MKTNPLLLLTTALLFSGASLQANDTPNGTVPVIIINPTPICGGADDDQNTANPEWVPLCGGMDDDQLRIPPPPSGPQNPAIAKLDQLDEASIIAILIGMLHGNDGDDTLHDFAMWAALTGDSMNGGNLWGDNGTDSLWTDMTTTVLTAPTSAPLTALGICGGNGNDSITGDGGADFLPRLQHAVQLIYGETGSDSINGDEGADLRPMGVAAGDVNGDGLYGGNGADTLVRKLARFVRGVSGFTCDPLDEDSLTGDAGDDIIRPSNRMVRLQQVAFSLGARSDVSNLSAVIISGLWGGGTDEIVGGGDADF